MVTREIQKKIVSYAVVMAMHENGLDLPNCFIPVVLQFVPEYDFTDAGTIKHDLEDVLDLPELMVTKILHLARDGGYVDFQGKNQLYRLRSHAAQDLIEKEESVIRRVRQLSERIQRYCIDHGVFPVTSVAQMIEAFIENCGLNLDFLHPDRAVYPTSIEVEDGSLKLLVRFLQDPTTNAADLMTFKEFVMGSIISKALEWTDLDSTNLTGFNTCELFLDTNFVFSLLGLHERRINKPVLEMHKKLIRRFDFRLKVFDFTLEQMKRVIRAYSPEDIVYAPDAQIPSIYNTFKGKRWAKEHAEKYAEKLPEELEKIGITIHDSGLSLYGTHAGISKTADEFVDLYKHLLAQYKPGSKEHGLQHDLLSIWTIQRMRGGPVRELGSSRAFFLTSDRRLAVFCEREMGHRSQGSISEVVLDMSFATMLWCLLKDQRIAFSINTIIAAFSRTLFISKKIWEKFMSVLSGMARKKRISLEEIPNIFYKKIQNVLSNFSDSDAHKVDEALLMAKIGEASTDSEVLHDKIYDMQEAIEIRGQQIEKQQAEINKLESLNKKAESKIEEYAKQELKQTLAVKVLLGIIIALVAVLVCALVF
jgi:hypothetical protein